MAGSRIPNSPSSNKNSSKLLDQEKFLPIANISRIMKKSLPSNAKISKEAKETVQECVSEFISFVTGEASDKCQREKRKTINGDDLLWAMTTLGFEDYVATLRVYLSKYKESEGEKNSMARQEDDDHDDGLDDHQNGDQKIITARSDFLQGNFKSGDYIYSESLLTNGNGEGAMAAAASLHHGVEYWL